MKLKIFFSAFKNFTNDVRIKQKWGIHFLPYIFFTKSGTHKQFDIGWLWWDLCMCWEEG